MGLAHEKKSYLQEKANLFEIGSIIKKMKGLSLVMNNSAFLILFIAFIALMGLIPFLLRRIQVPSVIALLLVGMLIGPTGIGLDLINLLSNALSFLGTPGAEAETARQTSEHFSSLVNSLGSLGLVMLMSLAGMEADFNLINSVRKPVVVLSIMTFLVPACAGYWVYSYFRPDDLPGKLLYASLFASHSVGIVFPVIRELNLTRTRFGAPVLISTVITDIASIILLAVSVQLFRQHQGISHMVVNNTLSIFDHLDSSLFANSFIPVFLAIVLVYLVASIFIVNYIGKRLLKLFHPGEDMLITIMLLVILATVLVGELFGINLVVGAFIAGLGLARVARSRGMLLFRRFESIGYGFLIPFLFVSIGMKTDFTVFGASGNLAIVLFTVFGLIASKLGSGFIAMRYCGFGSSASLAAGLMTVPQLSATLAAAAIGQEMGIIDQNFFNAIIILSIVTTLPVPNLVRWIISRSGEHFHEVPAARIPKVVNDDQLL